MAAPLDYISAPTALAEPQRSPLGELLYLAIPTIAQMVSYTLMQFIDTWMLSRLGVSQPTAAGNAGMLAWTFIAMGMGVTSVVNTFVSQNYGRGTVTECGRYVWQGIYVAVAFSILLSPVILLARPMFLLFGHTPELAGMESTYFQIVTSTMVFKLVCNTLAQFLLGINKPGQTLMASIMGVSTNALFAWILIFGHFGVPQLGLAGAAWAQNIGTLVEMSWLVFFVFRPELRRIYNLMDFRLRWPMMRSLLRIGTPAGLQFSGDVLVWSLFVIVLANRFGESAMAATTFTFRYMSVSFMPAIGLGTAVTTLVGRYIGRGDPRAAIYRTHLAFGVTAIYMLACGVLFFVGREWLMDLFTNDPEVLRIGKGLLIFAAFYQILDAMFVIYSGGLRGAGDTFVPAMALLALNWGITLGGGFLITRYLPELGISGPWYAATAYGISLSCFVFLRFKAGHWKHIKIESH